MGAMTIVEIVDSHQGFKVVTDVIQAKDKRQLMWVLGLLTFFMSAILDNLTTTIVMVSLVKKILPDQEDRKLFGAMIVIAANAGGAWTPIGDVTTTMLWINGQISALPTMESLFLPSIVSTLLYVFCSVFFFLFLFVMSPLSLLIYYCLPAFSDTTLHESNHHLPLNQS
jgi:Na+/H+ antiporter NhaD/arsenite permease-like protein